MKHRDLVSIVPYDSEGKILVHRRPANLVIGKHEWGFFGGGLEEGESPEDCLKRKVIKEMGVAPQNPILIHEQKYELEDWEGTWRVYAEKCSDPSSLKNLEGGEERWVSLDDATHLDDGNQDHSDFFKNFLLVVGVMKKFLDKEKTPNP